MIVEMPSGQKYHADVTDADCPHQNQCDYYGIYGYARAGFKKMDLVVRERCTGPHGSESCAIIAINGISNSAKGRWTLYRDGHRNAYPYNQITRETVPERLVFKFLSNT